MSFEICVSCIGHGVIDILIFVSPISFTVDEITVFVFFFARGTRVTFFLGCVVVVVEVLFVTYSSVVFVTNVGCLSIYTTEMYGYCLLYILNYLYNSFNFIL